MKIKDLFKFHKAQNQQKPSQNTLSIPTTASTHPFSIMKGYSPFNKNEYLLYDSLREAIPIIDAAINKIVRLIGDFHIESDNKLVEEKINKFLQDVSVNGINNGVESFLSTYLDDLLCYGTAIGEIVTDNFGNIKSLYNGSIKNISLNYEENPLNIDIYVSKNGKNEKIKNKNLIMLSTINAKSGEIYGTSILKGLPFVGEIFMKIFNSIGLCWDRAGNIRYCVTYKPTNGNEHNTKERVELIADQWSRAMKNTPEANDFIAVGDVSIKAIGSDGSILDSEVPIRQILEQIIAKLSIPPFLLGLSWSTTERMSSQQADILTSELESYRKSLNNVIKKICNIWLLTNKAPDTSYKIVWEDINMQDQLDSANARYLNAQAKKLETETEGEKN